MHRPYGSILHGLRSINFKSPFNKTGARRIFYAENMANIFELVEQGFDFVQIAKCFNVPEKTVKTVYRAALMHGFDRYPLRE